MKVTIYSQGDWDVGISSCESYVELPFEDLDKQSIEDVRKILHSCFHELHDIGETRVIFDFEEEEKSICESEDNAESRMFEKE